MKEKLIKLKKYGISSDTLKIIAIIIMIIDHVAYYFYNIIPDWAFYIMRYGFGRIGMPIFLYFIVQGFFNTKNFKKYVLRIAIFGVVTQLLITLGWFINKYIFADYIINIYTFGNILISFSLTLILLKVIHEPMLLKKYNKKQNMLFKIVFVILLLSIYVFVPLDYGIAVPLLAILLYAIERFRITVLISKSNTNTTFKGILYKSVDDVTIKNIYSGLIFFAILICVLYGELYWTSLFAIIPLYLYNGERKKKYNKFKYAYYVFFPVHHFVLYMIAMVIDRLVNIT